MRMKITGYMLRAALKRWELTRNAAVKKFPDVLHKFPDENKISPEVVAKSIEDAEAAIARLQAIQVLYNASVQVEVKDSAMSLAEAVKRVGGATRMEKMWKGAAGLETSAHGRYHNPFGAVAQTRVMGHIVQERTLSEEDAAVQATKAANYLGALQEAIASGNGQKLDMEVDHLLFAE